MLFSAAPCTIEDVVQFDGLEYTMSNSTSHLGGLGYPDVNNGPSILVSTTITTMLALAVVLARAYVRVIIVRNFGLDVSAKHLHQVL